MHTRSRLNLRLLLWLPAALLVAACASIGNPSGGPRDEDPPRFVRSNPAPGARDFSGKEISLYFNELVNVKDAFSKVIMSPPTAQTPKVSSLGRRVTVRFEDSLKANTTYTIDFGDAIEDNNEGNPLQNFAFTFSTGPDIDTLGISGMVLGAEDHEPVQSKFVGLHSDLSDSAFLSRPFDYIARTDDRGRFSFQGLKGGKYRVFALDDADGDRIYSSPEEAVAFYDVIVEPYSEQRLVNDTIRDLKTGAIDTIIGRKRRMNFPNDILLRSFTSRFKQQYLAKYERLDSTRFSFIFNSPSLTPATFSIVGMPGGKNWAVEERSSGNDSVTLWLKPRYLTGSDTLHVAVSFMATDSAMNLVARQDTLRMTFDRKKFDRLAQQARKEAEKKFRKENKGVADSAAVFSMPPSFLDVAFKSSSVHDVDRPIFFETSTPLENLDSAAVRLEEKRDTVWFAIPRALTMPDSLQPRRFRIEHPWKYGTDYRITVDSLALEGIYGLHNKMTQFSFKTREEGDYSSLTLRISGLDPSVPAFVQLLNQDKPVKSEPVENGVAVFRFLQPGKYYARLYEDYNGNGKYDPGDYAKGIQPDVAFYYPKVINLKKNWSKDETWNVFSTPVNLQKPEEILSNKPVTRKGTPQPKKQTLNEDDEE